MKVSFKQQIKDGALFVPYSSSAVIVTMHSMRGLVSVQASIVELTSEESLSELWRPRIILRRNILLSGLVSIYHRRCLEKRIAYVKRMVRMNNIVSLISKCFSRESL